MKNYRENLISQNSTGKQALEVFEKLPSKQPRTLFVIDDHGKLIGTVTDGDIRRGLLKNIDISEAITFFMFKSFKFLNREELDLGLLSSLRDLGLELVPILNNDGSIFKIINFTAEKSLLQIDAVIMAGGKGERLKPLTNDLPKPLLKVGDKPIIEYNIDLLKKFGISNIYITIKYLGEKIVDYFGDGSSKDVSIHYIKEEKPLGTLGAVSLIEDFQNEVILVMNSDLLTNIDIEDFYKTFTTSNADLCVACIPYQVNMPYAILETFEGDIVSFKEKPTYTYYSNAGIYLIKREKFRKIPKNQFYNATDLMESLIKEKSKVVHYPLLGYWLDIGKHDDYRKAQEDIKHIKL